jgi:hypothetical protein
MRDSGISRRPSSIAAIPRRDSQRSSSNCGRRRHSTLGYLSPAAYEAQLEAAA